MYSVSSEGRLPTDLDAATRLILSHAGDYLIRNNYIRVGYPPHGAMWEENRSGTGGAQYWYMGAFYCSEDMTAYLNRYDDACKAFVKAFTELQTVEQEKAKAHAKYLWEQA